VDHEKTIQGVERINLLRVPMDILMEEDLERVVRQLIQRDTPNQIVLLTYSEFMKARRDPERQRMLKEATLVLPTSRTLIRGAKFLKRAVPKRYMPFEFVIRLLGVLEMINGSIYILGEKNRDLNISSSNLRDSFPGVQIVGRHHGYLSQTREDDVVKAMQKTTPTLVLMGSGLKGKDRWYLRRKNELGAKFGLYCGECFKIFCGKTKKLSRKQWDSRGRAAMGFIKRPWKLFSLFSHLWFNLVLLVYRLRKL